MFIKLTKLDGEPIILSPAAISAIDTDGVLIIVNGKVEQGDQHTCVICAGQRYFVKETQAEVVEACSRVYGKYEDRALKLMRKINGEGWEGNDEGGE